MTNGRACKRGGVAIGEGDVDFLDSFGYVVVLNGDANVCSAWGICSAFANALRVYVTKSYGCGVRKRDIVSVAGFHLDIDGKFRLWSGFNEDSGRKNKRKIKGVALVRGYDSLLDVDKSVVLRSVLNGDEIRILPNLPTCGEACTCRDGDLNLGYVENVITHNGQRNIGCGVIVVSL